jgi:SAM-dependent methyltransferase
MRFLSVQPAAEAMTELYGLGYFESDFRCGRSETDSFAEDAFRAENAGLLDDFARLGPAGRLLEVGCAAGWLLKHAAERGWVAQGVELSAAAAAHARSIGVDVVQGDLFEASLPSASFDLVYMGDVLEHVPDCRRTLAEVARVLRSGGYLYLRGPITTNSMARRLALATMGRAGRTIVLREPPYHLWEFTPRPLRRLLGATGFELVRWRESKIPPGRPHGEKSTLERFALALIDAVNVPITRIANAWGDRVVLVARKQ